MYADPTERSRAAAAYLPSHSISPAARPAHPTITLRDRHDAADYFPDAHRLSLTPSYSTSSSRASSNADLHGNVWDPDRARVIAGHRKLSICECLQRGLLTTLRDACNTSIATGLRLATGSLLMLAKSRTLALFSLGACAASHIGVAYWMYGRIGPVKRDASGQAQQLRHADERAARLNCVAMALGAAAMLPAVFVIEKTSGTQTAMLAATAFVMQSSGNWVRDFGNWIWKRWLPAATLELAQPRMRDLQDEGRNVTARLDEARRLALVTATCFYALVLCSTGFVGELARYLEGDWIGTPGDADFPEFDSWFRSNLFLMADYVHAETWDAFFGQTSGNFVLWVKGVGQYLPDPESDFVRAPAALGPPLDEPLIPELTGKKAIFAEVALNSSMRSVSVWDTALLFWIGAAPVRAGFAGSGFDTARAAWTQALRVPLCLSEARGWWVQMIQKCALNTPLTAGNVGVGARAGSDEELRYHMLDSGPADWAEAGTDRGVLEQAGADRLAYYVRLAAARGAPMPRDGKHGAIAVADAKAQALFIHVPRNLSAALRPRQIEQAARDDKSDDRVEAAAIPEVGEDEGPRAAHAPRVALHHLERSADVGGEIDLVDDQQV